MRHARPSGASASCRRLISDGAIAVPGGGAQDERDALRGRVMEQQRQLDVLEDARSDLEARLRQAVAEHDNDHHSMAVRALAVPRRGHRSAQH